MTRSMWNGDPLLLASLAVLAAALLVMLGTRPPLPQEEVLHAASMPAGGGRVHAITGPLHLCRLPVPHARGAPVVAWQQGHEIVVAAARLDDALPAALIEALRLHAPTGVWHMPLQPWLGFGPDADHQQLRLPGLVLDCVLTHDE